MEFIISGYSVNSIAVERRISTKMVELFAGCGGLPILKQATFRITKKEHPEL